MSVPKPAHANRIKGPKGDGGRHRGVIIHTTEGGPGQTPENVVDYLANVRHLSVPVVVNDLRSVQMVPDQYHGEHAACVDGCYGVEQCAFARWTGKDWEKHMRMVERAAEWSAWWLATKVKVAVTEASLKRLVVGHNRDYVFGGCSDHWDPGRHYPWAEFRNHAIEYAHRRGWRLIATKGDRKIIRKARAGHVTRLRQAARKWRRRGWHVVVRRARQQAE